MLFSELTKLLQDFFKKTTILTAYRACQQSKNDGNGRDCSVKTEGNAIDFPAYGGRSR